MKRINPDGIIFCEFGENLKKNQNLMKRAGVKIKNEITFDVFSSLSSNIEEEYPIV